MSGADKLTEADQFFGLARVFTPGRAAEILRSLGLDEITECALKTRAYRKQIPFHMNGHRVIFTVDDLREIAEGDAHRPEAPREQAQPAAAVPQKARRHRRLEVSPASPARWRAREIPNA
jgi:hypothetical protein